MTLLRLALLATLLLPAAAGAQDVPATRLAYAVQAAGFKVMEVEATAGLGHDGYKVTVNFHTAGLLGFAIPSQTDSFAQGGWAGLVPAPLRYAAWGTLRGQTRRVTLDYVLGQPQVSELVPPLDEGREPVAPVLQRDTLDTLSGLAYLVHAVGANGACDGKARIFDGRRVMDFTSRTAGYEVLTAVSGSAFAGRALRCEMTSRQLGGFLTEQDAADRVRLRTNQVWLAPVVAGQPPLPVRVFFETRFFADATAYLTAAGPVER